jgi:hypothetical protein
MTDVATPRSRRRLFVIVGVIAVAVVALIVGGLLYGASAASDKAAGYDKDFAAWKAKDKPVLLAATAKLPTGTYLDKNTSGTKQLATQKKGCDAVAASRKKVKAVADRLPTMGGSMFGGLSSDFGDASDRSDRRAAIVGDYVKAASATLTQLERDCRWNISYNAAATRAATLFEKSNKYLISNGTVEPGAVCRNKDGCFSSITKKKNAYAALRLEALKLYRTNALPLMGRTKCGTTSYGTACKAVATMNDRTTATDLKLYTIIRASKDVVDDPKILSALSRSTKVDASTRKATREAIVKAFPEVKDDTKVTKAPDSPDEFLRRMAAVLLDKLDTERAALQKL